MRVCISYLFLWFLSPFEFLLLLPISFRPLLGLPSFGVHVIQESEESIAQKARAVERVFMDERVAKSLEQTTNPLLCWVFRCLELMKARNMIYMGLWYNIFIKFNLVENAIHARLHHTEVIERVHLIQQSLLLVEPRYDSLRCDSLFKVDT